jgi:hypothetical protein
LPVIEVPHDAGASSRDGGTGEARAPSQIIDGADYAKGAKIAGYFRMWARSSVRLRATIRCPDPC